MEDVTPPLLHAFVLDSSVNGRERFVIDRGGRRSLARMTIKINNKVKCIIICFLCYLQLIIKAIVLLIVEKHQIILLNKY